MPVAFAGGIIARVYVPHNVVRFPGDTAKMKSVRKSINV